MGKIKYKGVFTMNHRLFIMYAFAYSERQAWLSFCRRIANKQDVRLEFVTGLFDGSQENYKITEEA